MITLLNGQILTRCDFPEFPPMRGRTTMSQQWERVKRSPMKSAPDRPWPPAGFYTSSGQLLCCSTAERNNWRTTLSSLDAVMNKIKLERPKLHVQKLHFVNGLRTMKFEKRQKQIKLDVCRMDWNQPCEFFQIQFGQFITVRTAPNTLINADCPRGHSTQRSTQCTRAESAIGGVEL